MQTDQLDAAFFALSDATRRAILARLAEGEATVSELASPFDLRQPTVSKHLKVLESAGLIEQGRDAQRRPRKLVPRAMKELGEWIDLFRQQWEQRFENLDSHVLNSQAGEE